LAKGGPGKGYPFPWSLYRWLDGENAGVGRIDDLIAFATALAGFLTALRRIDATDGPPPGRLSAFRGGPLATYDAETRCAVEALGDLIDGDGATAAWNAALVATWHGPPVWFHADVAVGNLLVRGGRLAGVIDFGCSGVGDPACDLTIAWTLLSGESRDAFRAGLSVDSATLSRGRGWALWKASIVYAGLVDTNAVEGARAKLINDEVLAEYAHSA
jgi:aminoglycoside phosphotransferase (APT) family kinase protein